MARPNYANLVCLGFPAFILLMHITGISKTPGSGFLGESWFSTGTFAYFTVMCFVHMFRIHSDRTPRIFEASVLCGMGLWFLLFILSH